mmetsp:Transcript_24565/g.70805  ORF Transcript_24565/g.70805 Transcript_24565/m.70805 type:complete len:180 (+) Transcript_24565:585-1124(+)
MDRLASAEKENHGLRQVMATMDDRYNLAMSAMGDSLRLLTHNLGFSPDDEEFGEDVATEDAVATEEALAVKEIAKHNAEDKTNSSAAATAIDNIEEVPVKNQSPSLDADAEGVGEAYGPKEMLDDQPPPVSVVLSSSSGSPTANFNERAIQANQRPSKEQCKPSAIDRCGCLQDQACIS